MVKAFSFGKEKPLGKRKQKKNEKEMMNMKGYVYTLEIVIGMILMLVTFVSLFSNPPSKPEIEVTIIKQSGFNSLDFINREGLLRELVQNNSEAELESRLSALLSKCIKPEVEICAETCGTTGVSTTGNVITLDYYVSAFNENYMGRRVKLWLWRK